MRVREDEASGGLTYLEAVPLVIPKPVSTNRPRTLPTLVNPQRLFFLRLRLISQMEVGPSFLNLPIT